MGAKLPRPRSTVFTTRYLNEPVLLELTSPNTVKEPVMPESPSLCPVVLKVLKFC